MVTLGSNTTEGENLLPYLRSIAWHVVRKEAKSGRHLLGRCHVRLKAYVWPKEVPWGITHHSRCVPHIWRRVSLLRWTFWGKDTLFNSFAHIWWNISPFEVLGGKHTLFKAIYTCLEERSLHEDAMWHFWHGQTLKWIINEFFKRIWWNRKMKNGNINPFYSFKRKKEHSTQGGF